MAPLGQGSGFIGLPGDISPPSRFVRAVFYSQAAWKPESSGMDAVLHALRVMNSFFITLGTVRDTHDNELTVWDTFSDLAEKKYYFFTYENPVLLQMVDFKQLDLDAKTIKKASIQRKAQAMDVTTRLK